MTDKDENVGKPDLTRVLDIKKAVEKRKAAEVEKYGKKDGGDGGPDLPPDFIRECLRTNQHGDGELFKRIHKGRFLFCKSMGEWLRWTGHHWDIDQMNAAAAGVELVAVAYEDEARSVRKKMSETSDKETTRAMGRTIEALERRANQLRGENRRQTCLKFAHTSDNPLAIVGDEIDMNHWLLPCANGVIELKTGRFRSGLPDDFLLKASPVKWGGLEAPRDVWVGALLDIMAGDADMVSFLQRLFGMAIIGRVVEKIFPVLTGPGGDNGKTTIMEGISYAMGPMAGPIQSDMLVAGHRQNSSGPSPDIMSLKGLRIAYASETEDGAKVSAAKVKLFTGKDSLTGRWPNDKFPITFEPTHTLFLLSNFKPRADGNDKAFWSRIINIPFNMRFLKNREPEGENERKADPHLDDKLKEQDSGILAWLVEGCLLWQQKGLDIPHKVRMEAEEYQRGEDDMGAFLEYCTLQDPISTIGATDLYNVFCKWWKRFIGNFPPKQKRFGNYVRERYVSEKTGGLYRYQGLKLNMAVVDELGE